MLKAELEALCAEQKARIAELEAQVAEGAEDLVSGYLVFAGIDYTPAAGWDCYQQCFATENAAREFAGRLIRDKPDMQWAQIVELPTGRMEWFDED